MLTTPGKVKVSGRKRRRVVWVEERAGHVGSQSVDASARLHRTVSEMLKIDARFTRHIIVTYTGVALQGNIYKCHQLVTGA